MKKSKLKQKKKVPLWVIITLFLLFFVILVIGLFLFYDWRKDNREIKKLNKVLDEIVTIEDKEVPVEETQFVNPPVEEKESDYWYYVHLPFKEVDFTSLLDRNKDTVGYIHMENTNINYPIVSSGDNEYYLNHDFNKKSNKAGWIFLDYRNNLDNLSDNTVIYGHGRIDNTLFGSLKKVLTNSWQKNKENYVIRISTPKENMLFQIFSVYTIDAESYYITTNFVRPERKIKWIEDMKERNIAPINTEVSVEDKILTLSTCQNNNGKRIVVHAKLIKKETRS